LSGATNQDKISWIDIAGIDDEGALAFEKTEVLKGTNYNQAESEYRDPKRKTIYRDQLLISLPNLVD
jgi:hypothetical protein